MFNNYTAVFLFGLIATITPAFLPASPKEELNTVIKSLDQLSPKIAPECEKKKQNDESDKSKTNLFIIAKLGVPGSDIPGFKKINRSRVDFHTISKHYILNESDERISFLELPKDKMDIIFDLYGYDKSEKEDAHIITDLLQLNTEEDILKL